jgi:hypothetical protein
VIALVVGCDREATPTRERPAAPAPTSAPTPTRPVASDVPPPSAASHVRVIDLIVQIGGDNPPPPAGLVGDDGLVVASCGGESDHAAVLCAGDNEYAWRDRGNGAHLPTDRDAWRCNDDDTRCAVRGDDGRDQYVVELGAADGRIVFRAIRFQRFRDCDANALRVAEERRWLCAGERALLADAPPLEITGTRELVEVDARVDPGPARTTVRLLCGDDASARAVALWPALHASALEQVGAGCSPSGQSCLQPAFDEPGLRASFSERAGVVRLVRVEHFPGVQAEHWQDALADELARARERGGHCPAE